MLFKTWCCMPHVHALHLPSEMCPPVCVDCFSLPHVVWAVPYFVYFFPSIVLQHIFYWSHSHWSHGTGESWFPSYSSTSCSRTIQLLHRWLPLHHLSQRQSQLKNLHYFDKDQRTASECYFTHSRFGQAEQLQHLNFWHRLATHLIFDSQGFMFVPFLSSLRTLKKFKAPGKEHFTPTWTRPIRSKLFQEHQSTYPIHIVSPLTNALISPTPGLHHRHFHIPYSSWLHRLLPLHHLSLSHSWRTWTTSTIQSTFIQKLLDSQECKDRLWFWWLPPSTFCKEHRAFRLGPQSSTGPWRSSKPLAKSISLQHGQDQSDPSSFKSISRHIQYILFLLWQMLWYLQHQVSIIDISISHTLHDYIDYYLFTTYHWDSHSWRTWTTSTIQSTFIQKLLDSQECKDRLWFWWLPPSTFCKEHRAFRLGPQSSTGPWRSSKPLAKSISLQHGQDQSDPSSFKSISRHIQYILFLLWQMLWYLQHQVSIIDISISHTLHDYIDYYLFTTYHWDSHSWRTWTTSTIQSTFIQKLLDSQECKDRLWFWWLPPSTFCKEHRAFRLGLKSPAGTPLFRTSYIRFSCAQSHHSCILPDFLFAQPQLFDRSLYAVFLPIHPCALLHQQPDDTMDTRLKTQDIGSKYWQQSSSPSRIISDRFHSTTSHPSPTISSTQRPVHFEHRLATHLIFDSQGAMFW